MTTTTIVNAQGLLDVRRFVDAQKISGFQWMVLALCFLVVALDGFDTASIGFIAPALRADWGLSPAQLSPLLAAALAGLTIGALACGPLADRIGRKKVLMLSVAVFGGMTLAAAWADSVAGLTLARFLTGLGLGGAMPTAVTLMSEFCPQRRRSVLVTTMFCGFTLGSALGGIVSAHLVPVHGWRSVLALGGVLPLLLVPAMALWMPESARFLLLRAGTGERLRRTLQAIAPLPVDMKGFLVEAEGEVSAPVRQILAAPLRRGTLLLWGSFFMSLLIIYLLTNWLPTLIKDTGLTLSQAALLTALFQIGGTAGAIGLGAAMDKLNPYRVLTVAYALGALCFGAISQFYTNFMLLGLFVAGVGVFISGSQVGANALAASYYPTGSRATGVAWALGAGRVGSIFGSLVGGTMLGMGWGMHGIFALLMLPSALAALFIHRMGKALAPASTPGGSPVAAPAVGHPQRSIPS
ncbi:aromatic acid/H+ symport family MFS transporter [Ideonella sp. B508-1]|uniref:MFS transporter n=1 Tax=Ideonella sp. B508-1 TaxID=137716 RepID=UPI0003481A4C|nr:aromatic acid/H+ symport family MFS transporter [Ideonella sp. B508-1]